MKGSRKADAPVSLARGDSTPEEWARDVVKDFLLSTWSNDGLRTALEALQQEPSALLKYARNGNAARESKANPYQSKKLNELLGPDAVRFRTLLAAAHGEGCDGLVIRELCERFARELEHRRAREKRG